MDLLDGKTNGAVDLADRPVTSDNMARLLGEADSFEGPTFTDLKEQAFINNLNGDTQFGTSYGRWNRDLRPSAQEQ
jgi:hypothetical protein